MHVFLARLGRGEESKTIGWCLEKTQQGEEDIGAKDPWSKTSFCSVTAGRINRVAGADPGNRRGGTRRRKGGARRYQEAQGRH